VAFTIEFDNEAEHRLLHRTTTYGPSAGAGGGPWLVSMVMWLNCLRFVPVEGITVRELERLARTRTNWDGMRRWGYIFFEPDPADNRPKPPQSALVVRATSKGRVAQEVCGSLIGVIEERWRERFGGDAIDDLRCALAAVASHLGAGLPDCLPILKYGLVSEGPEPETSPQSGTDYSGLPLPALLARVLLAFALEFERESEVSLAICADVLRVVDEKGTAVRDLPGLSGVSKEAIAMALSFLTKHGYAGVHASRRVKTLLLTPEGVQAHAAYQRLLTRIESRWAQRYGEETMQSLREALEPIAGDGTVRGSRLYRGLQPYPEGWRASVGQPATLPHYPMVLHRGGFPDGS
jgi:DNA-binding MarR family transcriptional regulator